MAATTKTRVKMFHFEDENHESIQNTINAWLKHYDSNRFTLIETKTRYDSKTITISAYDSYDPDKEAECTINICDITIWYKY